MPFDDPKPVLPSSETLQDASSGASPEQLQDAFPEVSSGLSTELYSGALLDTPSDVSAGVSSETLFASSVLPASAIEETTQAVTALACDAAAPASSQGALVQELPDAAPAPLSALRALALVLSTGLVFALVGLLIGLRVVAAATLPHILQPGEYINFKDVTEGLPVPRLLAWNLGRVDFLDSLRGLSGFSLLLPTPLVFGPLWLLCVRRVNPTFRLFGEAPNAPAARLQSRAAVRMAAPADIPTAPALLPDTTQAEVDAVTNNAVTNPAQNQPAFMTATDADTTFSRAAAKTVSRATPAPGSSAADALGAVVEFYGLMKALTLLLMIGLGVAAVWILVDFEGDIFERGVNSQMVSGGGPLIGVVWLMRLGLLGAAFWVGFHRDGIAGDFTQPDWNTRSRRLFTLGIQGLLFGLLMYALCRAGLPQHLEETLLRLQTLGALTIPLWEWVTRDVLVCFGAIGFAIGVAFTLFSSRNLLPAQRLLFWLLPPAALGVALLAQRDFAPAALAARFDVRPALLATLSENAFTHPEAPILSVPDGLEAARQMAQIAHLRLPDVSRMPGRTLVLFDKGLSYLVYQNSFDIDNLPCDTATDGLVTDFLRRRDYQTAFSWLATKHLFNAALVRLDNTRAIQAGILDLTHSPHNTQFGRPTLLPMFSVCAATPQNLALLNQWADETKFELPDRSSKRLMGDLYRRFGKPDEALRWYRKADMPGSFLKRVSAEKPVLSTGRMDGVLRLNGKPLAGIQVAVIPARLNGLPRGLEEAVLYAAREITASDGSRINPAFGMGYVQPYSLRWISASAMTDAQGRYHIANLTEGEYVVTCTLPRDIQTRLPYDERLNIAHPPAPFTVNYSHPAQDMGATDITFQSDAQPSARTEKQP